ncbi:MAG TPA: DUF1501 domain-containing protein [Planctomycetota bacterium]|nr:DUF1501 domain-containing protein [Planctomycetota bacterium]
MKLDERTAFSRRAFLGRATSLGAVALAALGRPGLLGAGEGTDARGRGAVFPYHVPPRAKRVIWLYQSGGPSHLETFDYKPKLAELHGQPFPESITKGQPIAQLQGAKLTCFAPQWGFKRYGRSGQLMTELFPHLGEVADDLCIIRSMVTEQINHDPAHTFMNTGTSISGRPSMGSWLWYGLGTESENLPGFVVLTSFKGRSPQPIATRHWSSGFLPSRYQGVHFRSQGEPVLYLGRPDGVTRERQRDVVDAVRGLNELHDAVVDDPEIATRIGQYEMAFRMQTSVPELMDFSDEPPEILKMYGTQGADGTYAANCLLARRLAERGVRFIQVYNRDWDYHDGIRDGMKLKCEEADRPTAALLRDLKQRGMLDETIVVFGGEFGRTPMAQGNGRDHHIKGFSMFVAGGGFKGGMSLGATDEFGYYAVEDVVHVHDLHATMLHLLGVDHTRLTYKFQGRDFRLTDVHGRIVRKILA